MFVLKYSEKVVVEKYVVEEIEVEVYKLDKSDPRR
jgi:hypothetical protein